MQRSLVTFVKNCQISLEKVDFLEKFGYYNAETLFGNK